MPYLEDGSLFIHTPRCAGSSVEQRNKVEKVALKGKGLWHKLVLYYFFYRMYLLRQTNFPVVSIENAIAFTSLFINIIVLLTLNDTAVTISWYPGLPVFFIVLACITFICSTFVGTASVMGRINWTRRLMIFIAGKILCECGGDTKDAITGITSEGFLIHFSARKMLSYKFATKKQLNSAFTIVRNPFARMVSLYAYNKFPYESFGDFMERWHANFEEYRVKHNFSDDCHTTYCHLLPMKAFTHSGVRPNSERLVGCVVRQEDLEYIQKLPESVFDKPDRPAPDAILQIGQLSKLAYTKLKGIPHVNGRSLDADWPYMYNQRTMELCLDMYSIDFSTFGYPRVIPGRSDLVDPMQSQDHLISRRVTFLLGSPRETEEVRKPSSRSKQRNDDDDDDDDEAEEEARTSTDARTSSEEEYDGDEDNETTALVP